MTKTAQVDQSVTRLRSYFDEADMHLLLTDLVTKRGWLFMPGMQRFRSSEKYRDVPPVLECIAYDLGVVDLPSKGLKSPTFSWVVKAFGWVDVKDEQALKEFMVKTQQRFSDSRTLVLKAHSVTTVLSLMSAELASHAVGVTAMAPQAIRSDGRISVMKSSKPPKLILL